MANVKISELPAAAPLDGTETLPVVQDAATAQATVADVIGLITDADIPSTIARDTEVTAAVSAHAGAANPHPTYATDTDLSGHEADTTAIHGITDTAALETTTGSAAKVATHSADTTAVHGITDTADLVLTSDTRLTNARTPSGAAGGVLSGTYPDPGFAADMATQAELDAHTHSGTYVAQSLFDAAGDLLTATANDTPAKLSMGSALQVLRVNAGATALEYATPAGGGMTPLFKSGAYTTSPYNGADSTNITPVVSQLYVMPLWIPSAMTVDRLAINMAVGAGAGGVVRLGIYSDASATPGTLLVQTSAVATTGTGTKEDTVNQALTAGSIYWLAVVFQVAVASMKGIAAGGAPVFLPQAALTSNGYAYYQASVTGTLPSPFVATGLWGGAMPLAYVRIV